MLGMLAEHLPARFPDRFRAEGSLLLNRASGEVWDLADPDLNALEAAALLVQVRT